ncbi:MAG: heme-binding protein [Candidatus Hydrogenedentes bacterium]|nr:heme-binding protein [Candidatus Hydrogenedentota bacterium]
MRSKLMTGVCVVFIVALAGISGHAPVSAQSGTVTGHDVTLAAALRVIDACIEKATAQDTKMNIAVVDAGGNLKAFVRMDGSYLGSIDIAQRKARTSRLFDAPSGALGTMTQPGQPLYGLEASNGGLITFGGGIPLRNKAGVVIGAVGVSGSSVENDVAVAEAGAAAF